MKISSITLKNYIPFLLILFISLIFHIERVLCEEMGSHNYFKGVYVVQAGAFNDLSNAKAFRKKLDEMGYNAYIILSESEDKKDIYKVCIGKFVNKKDAEDFSNEINRNEEIKSYVSLEQFEGIFVVQVGAFNDLSYAKALRKKLDDKGYNAYITFSDPNRKTRFNVYIGNFMERKEAEKLSEKITKEENISTFVTLR